jgi:Ca2+-binding EF-hand superfamily protein
MRLRGAARNRYKVSAEEIRQMMEACDIDGDGEVSFDEFVTTMIDWTLVEEHDTDHFHEVIDRAFDVSVAPPPPSGCFTRLFRPLTRL